MKVRTVKPFKNRGELIPVGTVLKIRDEDYPQLIGKVEPVEPFTADQLQNEYFALLRRFWQIVTDPAATMDEARQLVTCLDQIYRQLHRLGRRVPVRLPVERNQAATQRELAL